VTNKAMLSFKKWFERRIAHYAHKRFLNATQGGAFIEGASPIDIDTLERELKEMGIGHQLLEERWPLQLLNEYDDDVMQILKSIQLRKVGQG